MHTNRPKSPNPGTNNTEELEVKSTLVSVAFLAQHALRALCMCNALDTGTVIGTLGQCIALDSIYLCIRAVARLMYAIKYT